MSQRNPKIKLHTNAVDRFRQIFGLLLLAGMWIFVFYHYSSLPEMIPVHYNGYGEIDDYGSKSTLFILPVLATVFFWIFTKLIERPDLFNYPVRITRENAAQQYHYAVELMQSLRLVVIMIFFAISFETVYIARHEVHRFKFWIIPTLFVLVSVPIVRYLVRSLRKEKKT